jgi:hypothetical protein
MKILYRLSDFRGDDFLEIDQPETRFVYIWWPCLLTDQNKISNLYRGPCIHR